MHYYGIHMTIYPSWFRIRLSVGSGVRSARHRRAERSQAVGVSRYRTHGQRKRVGKEGSCPPPPPMSVKRRLAFRNRDTQNGSCRVIVDISANILDFARGASNFCKSTSRCEGRQYFLCPPILKYFPPPLIPPHAQLRHTCTIRAR